MKKRIWKDMNVKTIKNISNENVELSVGNGSKLTLSPGSSFNNIQVENLNQVKEKVKIVTDLGEVNETNTSKSKLYS
jgi:archaellum component FlaG (FlaF/FlaG flagellin family)